MEPERSFTGGVESESARVLFAFPAFFRRVVEEEKDREVFERLAELGDRRDTIRQGCGPIECIMRD